MAYIDLVELFGSTDSKTYGVLATQLHRPASHRLEPGV